MGDLFRLNEQALIMIKKSFNKITKTKKRKQ